MRYAIVGSGKFGRELTRILLNNGKKVLLFSRRATEIDSINSNSKSNSSINKYNLSLNNIKDFISSKTSSTHILIKFFIINFTS